MNVTVTETGGVATIVVDGNIEVVNFKNFQEKLTSIADRSTNDIVINMINMDYISSTTIGDLLNLKKSQKKKGKRLIFKNISAGIVNSLKYCQLLEEN